MADKAFGSYKPTDEQLKIITHCRQLKPNWLNKQRAQMARKKVLKNLSHPLDLTLDGMRLRCHFHDNISERSYVFMPWRYDPSERELLKQYLPDSGVFVDVGANIGLYSCQALSLLNQHGCVVAIEPNPEVIKRLKFNLQATTENVDIPPAIHIIEKGVSDQAGQFALYLNQDNLGASSIYNKSDASITIDCEPLMTLLYQKNIQKVDVMKVDIEGAEDMALVPFLSQANDELLPNCLIIEDNDKQWQLPLQDTLKSKHYELIAHTRMNRVYAKKQSTAQKLQFTDKRNLIQGDQLPTASKISSE